MDKGQWTKDNVLRNVVMYPTPIIQYRQRLIGLTSTPTTSFAPCSLALSQKLAGSEVLEEISGVCK